MNADSAAKQNDSALQADLNRYKQAAELAYRYVKTKADENTKEKSSPFDEETKTKSTENKELA